MKMLAIAFGVLGLLLSTPAQAEWRRAESANFIVYGNLSENALRQRTVQLENFDRLMRFLTSSAEPVAVTKLHIYILDGARDLRRVVAVPAGIGGYYMATIDGIAALVDGEAAGGNETLLHEYAHHFMMQNETEAYPAWYVEGFAEYFSTVRFESRGTEIGHFSPGRAYSLLADPWLPFERVISGGPQGLDREEMAAYYAQSWLLTHFFYSTPERSQSMGRFFAAQRGNDPVAALQTAMGLTPQQLTDELRRYVRGRLTYRRLPPDANATAAVTVTSMPRSTDDMILFEAKLRIGVGADEGQSFLQEVRTAASRHPDDPFARRVLAHAELLYGDGAVADNILDGLLAAAPNDAELMYLKGMRYLVAVESDTPPEDAAAMARRWFGRAYRVDGNHFQTLYRYAQSQRGEAGFVSENTSNILLLARQLAPQVSTITMNAAALLTARGQHAEAIGLLRPLAVNPHDPRLATHARQLIERAQREADQGGVAASE